MSKGLVIKNTGSWYVVKYGEDLVVNCKVKGNFRLKGIRTTNPVAVGDIVDFIANDDGTAYIKLRTGSGEHETAVNVLAKDEENALIQAKDAADPIAAGQRYMKP